MTNQHLTDKQKEAIRRIRQRQEKMNKAGEIIEKKENSQKSTVSAEPDPNKTKGSSKKRFLYFFLLFIIVVGIIMFIINKSNWERTYGTIWKENLLSIVPIVENSGGGYLVAGYTESKGWLIRLKSDGEKIWEKTFGGGQSNIIDSIIQISENEFILSGETKLISSNSYDGWLINIDSKGNDKWQKIYGGDKDDFFDSIILSDEGELIIVGCTSSDSNGGLDGWFLKLNTDGNLEKEKNYGGNGNDRFLSIIQTIDGHFAIAGKKDVIQGYPHAWFVLLDANGGLVNERTFINKNNSTFQSIVQTKEGDFILAGSTYSEKTDSADPLLVKLNRKGNILWEKTFFSYKYNDGFNSIVANDNNGYAAVIWTKPKIDGYSDSVIITLDSDGNEIWKKRFGGEKGDGLNSIINTSDGGYIAVGGTASKGAGDYDGWLVRLEKN